MVLDKRKVRDSIFSDTSQKREDEKDTSALQNFGTSEVPKFQTFDVKLSVLLTSEQLDYLDGMVKTIMKSRVPQYKKERITKNTIVRCLVEVLKEVNLDTKNIPDEEELLRRLKEKLCGVMR